MSDIKFIDFFKHHSGNSLTDRNHFVFIQNKNNDPNKIVSIILNIETTDLIIQKECYFVRMAYNEITGDYYLVFQKEKTGVDVNIKPNNPRGQINCRELCRYLIEKIGIDFRKPFEVSGNIANRPDMITIHIRK